MLDAIRGTPLAMASKAGIPKPSNSGTNTIASAPVSADEKKGIQKRYTDGIEYFVFVGSMHARKNVERMLLAFNQMKSKSNSEVKMVLVGAPMWSGSSIAQTVEQLEHKKDILFVGRKELLELLHRLLSRARKWC